MPLRSPIIVVVGHVDHGKSTLLDKIRETAVQKSELGGMTQCIGATEIPASKIEELSGDLLKKFGITLEIPGLLAIDTPGHEAFSNLRKRGGSVANIAILVIDISQGVQPQTRESIEILKSFKVPFVIAANKVDLVNGWVPQKTSSYLESIKHQNQQVKDIIQNKVYNFMNELATYGINCDLFNNINDFTKSVAIVPCSAVTGEGISELLVVISGLAQKYLSKNLEIKSANAKGSVLEVKEAVGLGTVIDVILYDGVINKDQLIVVGGADEPIITKIRALLEPCPLQEIRDKKCSFEKKDSIVAARGIRISAPNLEKAIAGMPLESAKDMKEALVIAKKMKEDIKSVILDISKEGIVLKADSLGSLEALNVFLTSKGISLCKAGIGDINKMDVLDAVQMKQKDLYYGVIMGFGVKVLDDAKMLADKQRINIITADVIYHLFEQYDRWKNEIMEEKKREALNSVVIPSKIQVLGEFVFRKSKPAIVGVEVLNGVLKTNVDVINESGTVVGHIKDLQDNGVSITQVKEHERVACSIEGATYEKDLFNKEILYTSIPEKDFLKIKNELKSFLTKGEIEVLKQIAEIKRKTQATWGMG
ncbi:putative translation initiation factor IF-2 [Candidatus Tiddalikarchaeum anstoanum]|nr:putative translation initiation factor IF-2 [Candidatus Tiddalikarchaeum anstoanum]